MSYAIRTKETFEKGIERIIYDQTKKTIGHLMQRKNVHEGVHDARRCMKMIRAVWRLIRDDLEESEYQKKNSFYRDAARQISDLRDLAALLETLEMMGKMNAKVSAWISYQAFKKELQQKIKDLDATGTSSGANSLPKQVGAFLLSNYSEINRFQLSENYRDKVISSIQRVYTRGYRACRICKDNPTPENMHEWRKRGKYLRYQLRILRNVWPALFGVWEKELHQLTDYLGDYNNLSVMKEHLLDETYALKKIYRTAMTREADRHQQRLHASAVKIGVLLYHEQPYVFARRIEGYLSNWEVWKLEAYAAKI